MHEAAEEDEDPRALLEEGGSSAMGLEDVHETDDEPKKQVDDAEVHGENHVLLKSVPGGGSVQWIGQVVHADERTEVV